MMTSKVHIKKEYFVRGRRLINHSHKKCSDYSQSGRSLPCKVDNRWKINSNDWMTIQILLLLFDSILFEYFSRWGELTGLRYELFPLQTTINIDIQGSSDAIRTKFNEDTILVSPLKTKVVRFFRFDCKCNGTIQLKRMISSRWNFLNRAKF